MASACRQDTAKLLAEWLGRFYVFHMDHDQSNCIKILVVDDHSFIREAVTKLLNGEDGFDVCAQASSGLEAVQLPEQLTPDVIVLV
jgi:PleD family two-component response regulator